METKSINNVQNEEGIWIPGVILFNNDLSLREKFLLAKIFHLDNESGCYANNKYFSNYCGISRVQISTVDTPIFRTVSLQN